MKARLPYEYERGAAGTRKRSVAAALLLFCRALRDYGMSVGRINEWIGYLNQATAEVAGYNGSGYGNKTWQDELDYWTEKYALNVPRGEQYRLLIEGAAPAGGSGQRLLLCLELYALRYMGFGEVRLKRVLACYAKISGLYTDGRAKYTKKQLESWADGAGVVYK